MQGDSADHDTYLILVKGECKEGRLSSNSLTLHLSSKKVSTKLIGTLDSKAFIRKFHVLQQQANTVLLSFFIIDGRNWEKKGLGMNARKPHAGCELNNTVVPLYMNLQVFVNFQRCKCAFSCPIAYISSPVWSTVPHVFSLYQQLCFCVLYGMVLNEVQQYSVFISSPGCLEARVKVAVKQLVLLRNAKKDKREKK